MEEFDSGFDPLLFAAVGAWAREEEPALVVEGLPGGGDGDAGAVEVGEGEGEVEDWGGEGVVGGGVCARGLWRGGR